VSDRTERAAEWVYRGLWKVLSDGFRVPEHPPTLPTREGDFLASFHPSRRYLSYLKLWFWFGLVAIDLLIFLAWTGLFFWHPRLAMVLLVPALIVAVVPDILAYVAIHLRYDTMWYVMSDRSLRCRRGIWVILEHTITFENVQNVFVHRGPVQNLYGISTVVLETAGAAEGEGHSQFAVGNKAIMEGIDNPKEIRELILERVRRSKTAGLGDELESTPAGQGWRAEHLGALREILAEVRALEGGC
jgi:membrane protein YdbS with pleckstrin-like domain